MDVKKTGLTKMQKIRAECVYQKVDKLTINQARTRIHPGPVPKTTKAVPPPSEKGNELWQNIYKNAVKSKHPNPVLMADSALRAREKALDIEKARHLTQFIDKNPKTLEAPPPAPKKTGRTVPPPALRCRATKMDGKQCEFKCKNGDFCTKHSLKN
jgi:hypothetical protein